MKIPRAANAAKTWRLLIELLEDKTGYTSVSVQMTASPILFGKF